MSTSTHTAHSYEMPPCVRDFMGKALELGVVEAGEMWALGVTHGYDFVSMMDEVVYWAWLDRHFNLTRHATLCQMRDLAVKTLSEHESEWGALGIVERSNALRSAPLP